MQVSNTVLHPCKRYYQILVQAALVIILCLVAGSLWAILCASNSSTLTASLTDNLAKTTAYYDKVQGLEGITTIEYVKKPALNAVAACTHASDSTWSILNFNFDGVAGGSK
jgi:hypothetical protein